MYGNGREGKERYGEGTVNGRNGEKAVGKEREGKGGKERGMKGKEREGDEWGLKEKKSRQKGRKGKRNEKRSLRTSWPLCPAYRYHQGRHTGR